MPETSPQAAIGTVVSLTGTAQVRHADGTTETARAGQPLFTGDTLETAAGAQLGLNLVDGTALSLGGGGRMVLDDVVFDPAAASGHAVVAVDKGVFGLASGAIAHIAPDALQLRTPVLTVGVRGTTVAGQVAQGGTTQVALLPDANGTVGQVAVSNQAGTVVLSSPLTMVSLDSPLAVPPQPLPVSQAVIDATFGQALQVLPPPSPPPAPTDSQPSQLNDSEGETTDSGDATFTWFQDSRATDDDTPPAPTDPLAEDDPLLDLINELSDVELDQLQALLDEATADEGDEGEDLDLLLGDDEDDDAILDDDETEEEDVGTHHITGTAHDDDLYGTDGNDVIRGLAGNDTLHGGAGADTLIGGPGSDLIYLGADDRAADVVVYDSADLGAPVDTIHNFESMDSLDLSAFASSLNTGNGAGLGGAITVNGTLGSGVTVAIQDAGDYYLFQMDSDGDGTADLVSRIFTTYGSGLTAFYLNAEGTLSWDADTVAVDGGQTLFGDSSTNTLNGGGHGNDRLYGEAGNDVLVAGTGSDTLVGGSGADQFQLANDSAVDLIADYTPGTDSLVLSNALFGLGYSGTLTDGSNYFEATDLSQVGGSGAGIIVIGSGTGGDSQVYYCSDLSDAANNSYQVATLSGTPTSEVDATSFTLAA